MRTHKERAWHLLDRFGEINPYNRQRQNLPREYWVWQAGFATAILADLMAEDPDLSYRIRRLIEAKRG